MNGTSNNEAVRAALKLAKDGALEKALVKTLEVDEAALLTPDLRSLALAYSYCGEEHQASRIWEQVSQKSDSNAGDNFMLASSQTMLGESEKAISNFRLAIESAQKSGNTSYLSVSAIHLAHLLFCKGEFEEARESLSLLEDHEGTHIQQVGYLTKRMLMDRLDEKKI